MCDSVLAGVRRSEAAEEAQRRREAVEWGGRRALVSSITVLVLEEWTRSTDRSSALL